MIDTFAIRCSVLHLAFSGVLTEHIETDGNISDLLTRANPTKSIAQTENVPYDIPASWAWVKLSDLYKINPKVEADDNIDSAFVSMEKISAGFDRSFSYEIQNWAQASKNHTRFTDGDVAFAKITPCFENRKSFIACGLPNGIGGGTTELIILRQSEMLPEYTYYLILDQRFILTGTSSYKGTVGQQRVQSDVIKNYLVPVPPYEEQKRIVEKIQQAFSILDTIDTLQTQYHNNLAILKSKLIDAGIQGKLTEQLPEDSTAEELYQQIQQEKQALEKAGKIKKSKPLPPVSDEEKPFDIPENWKWIRLKELGVFSGGKTPSMANHEYWDKGDVLWITSKDMKRKYISASEMMITKQAAQDMTIYPENTVLFVVRSGILRRLFPVAILKDKGTINQDLKAIELYIHDMHEYVYYLLKGLEKTILFQYTKDGTTVNNIVFDSMLSMPLPLPPLAEQRRIVAKLEELLPLCEG